MTTIISSKRCALFATPVGESFAEREAFTICNLKYESNIMEYAYTVTAGDYAYEVLAPVNTLSFSSYTVYPPITFFTEGLNFECFLQPIGAFSRRLIMPNAVLTRMLLKWNWAAKRDVSVYSDYTFITKGDCYIEEGGGLRDDSMFNEEGTESLVTASLKDNMGIITHLTDYGIKSLTIELERSFPLLQGIFRYSYLPTITVTIEAEDIELLEELRLFEDIKRYSYILTVYISDFFDDIFWRVKYLNPIRVSDINVNISTGSVVGYSIFFRATGDVHMIHPSGVEI